MPIKIISCEYMVAPLVLKLESGVKGVTTMIHVLFQRIRVRWCGGWLTPSTQLSCLPTLRVLCRTFQGRVVIQSYQQGTGAHHCIYISHLIWMARNAPVFKNKIQPLKVKYMGVTVQAVALLSSESI